MLSGSVAPAARTIERLFAARSMILGRKWWTIVPRLWNDLGLVLLELGRDYLAESAPDLNYSFRYISKD